MSFPSADDALCLHQRLLADDPAAYGDVCQAFLAPLLGYLRRRHGDRNPDLLYDAAHQALIGYVKNPRQYDPDRNPDLGAYLRMAASGDALNLLKQEARRQRGRATVELDALAGNLEGEDAGPALRLIRAEEGAEHERLIEAVERECDESDRAVLRLILDGAKATAAYAAALGVSHLPIDEQERLVKQAKDRVKKRLRRFKRHA